MKQTKVRYKRLPKLIKHEQQAFDYHLVKRKGDIAWYVARYLNGSETQGWVVAKISHSHHLLRMIRATTTIPSLSPSFRGYQKDQFS